MPTDVSLPGLLYDPSRHGRPRWYVRQRGRRARLEGIDDPPPLTLTPRVLAAYRAACEALAEASPRALPGQGSFAWLVETYRRSPTFARLHPLTRRERASVLGRIAAAHGAKPYVLMRARHVEKIRDAAAGTAANKRVKCLRYLFKWAIAAGHAIEDPARDVGLLRIASTGYTAWSREDVLRFEAHHPVGTKARLALAILQYTGVRRSDAAQMGPANLRSGRLIFTEHKGRGIKPKRRSIPLIEPLRQVLDASPLGRITFLETDLGQPFTIAGLGNKFRSWCDAAGLQGLTAHGVRKGMGTLLAERGCTAHQIMAILGHRTLDEAERYTRAADEVHLTDAGFARAFGDEV